MKKTLLVVISFLLVFGMLLSACAPKNEAAPAEEAAPVEEEAAPAEEEAAPVEEEAAPAEEEAAPAEEAEEEAAPAGPTQIVFNEPGGYTSLDPFTNAWHATPTYAVFCTLVVLTPDIKEYVPYVAESWSFSEDNLSMTIKLREDVTFTDGTPVNAEAVNWNFLKHLDPELASPGGGTLRDSVESTEVIDEYTIKLNLFAPYAPLLNYLSGLEIASPTAYEEMGPDVYAQNLISCGPWKVKEIVPDVSITYVKNEDHTWGPAFLENTGPMQIDELVIKYISDESVTYAALETGEVQLASVPPQFLGDAQANENIEVFDAVTTTLAYFGMNNEFAPFDNVKVRQAIAYAIDRDMIVDIAYEGRAIATYQTVAAGNQGYNPDLEEYGMATSNDVDMAMQMLDEEGYLLNESTGIREKDGVAMDYTLMFVTDPTTQRIAETLQAQLMQIGINTTLEPVEGTVMRERTAAGDHQMFTWIYGMLDPMITTYIFDSARIGASNRNHVNDPALDALLDAQDQALDPVARQLAVNEVTKYLIDMRFHVPLLTPIDFVGYRADLVDIALDDLGGVIWADTKMK